MPTACNNCKVPWEGGPRSLTYISGLLTKTADKWVLDVMPSQTRTNCQNNMCQVLWPRGGGRVAAGAALFQHWDSPAAPTQREGGRFCSYIETDPHKQLYSTTHKYGRRHLYSWKYREPLAAAFVKYLGNFRIWTKTVLPIIVVDKVTGFIRIPVKRK